MSDLVIGLVIGAGGALVVTLTLLWGYLRDLARRQAERPDERDAMILEMRQEAAEDRETNRRLRHELAVTTPAHLLETASAAEIERDGAVSERDQALEQLDLVQRDLAAARSRLADQDTKLRQYREALQEIRLALEAQGSGRSAGPASSVIDTGDLVLAPEPEGHDEPVQEIEAADPLPADVSAGD